MSGHWIGGLFILLALGAPFLLAVEHRVSAWRSRRRLIRREPEQLLEPVGDRPVFPGALPMRVRGHNRYPEHKPTAVAPLRDTRRARSQMHAQIEQYLTKRSARRK
jgi:hypothetical protein